MQTLMTELKQIRKYIPVQAYRTIKGQILAGDLDGARKGIEKFRAMLNA